MPVGADRGVGSVPGARRTDRRGMGRSIMTKGTSTVTLSVLKDCVMRSQCASVTEQTSFGLGQNGATNVSDPSVGRLLDEPAWRRALGAPEILDALVQWARGQPFDVELMQVHTEGASGSFVATVSLHRRHGRITGAILKILPAHLADKEVRGAKIAAEAGPPSFVEAHLTLSLDGTGPLPGNTGRWIHLQRVAQSGPTDMVPLAALAGKPEFVGHCTTILTALGRDWNDEGADPHPPAMTPRAFLQQDLAGHLAGLRWFASAAGWDFEKPADAIRVPGRAGPLPNPFTFLAPQRDPPGTVPVFLGHGHGDLHLDNVMLPTAGGVADATRFRLIDLGRFRTDMEISRDPAKLLLAVAGRWLGNLRAAGSLRSQLAEIVVNPADAPESAETAGYVSAARRLHDASAAWAEHRGLVPAWKRQHRLVLGAAALRTVSRDDLPMNDRWWYLEV